MKTDEQRARHREEQRRYRERNREMLRVKNRGWRARMSPEKLALRREYERLWALNKRAALRAFLGRREAEPVGAVLRRQLMADDIYAAAHAVVPRHLPEFVRDDVIADLCLGVLAGDFTLDEMSQHVKAVTARHRGATDKFGTVSLDAVIGDDGFTRGQMLGVY